MTTASPHRTFIYIPSNTSPLKNAAQGCHCFSAIGD